MTSKSSSPLIKFAEKKEQRLHIGNLRSFGPHVSLLKQPTPVIAPHIDYDTTRKTRHESLPILLHAARKTPHRGRTTPPSCTKWWSCVFREWIGPLATKWSAMVASTLFFFKILFSSVWQTTGRSTCFRQLGQSFIVFALGRILLSHIAVSEFPHLGTKSSNKILPSYLIMV